MKTYQIWLIYYNNYNNYTVKNCVYNNKLINRICFGDFDGNHPINDFVKPLLNNYNIDEFNIFCINIQNTITVCSKYCTRRSIYKIDTQNAINIIQNIKLIFYLFITHTEHG